MCGGNFRSASEGEISTIPLTEVKKKNLTFQKHLQTLYMYNKV